MTRKTDLNRCTVATGCVANDEAGLVPRPPTPTGEVTRTHVPDGNRCQLKGVM